MYLGIDIGGTAVKIGLVTENGKIIVSNSYDVAFDNYDTPIFNTVKNAMYLGIDIGGTAVKIGLVTENGKIIVSNSYDVAFDNYDTPIFNTVKNAIEIFINENAIELKNIKGIGVSEIIVSNSYDVAFDNYDTPIFNTVKNAIEIFINENAIELKNIKGIGVSATGQVNTTSGKIIGVGGNIKKWCDTEIKKELEDISIELKNIKGIGVSATGQVNTTSGKIIGVGGNIKKWCDTEIKKELEDIYNLNTTVVNDANCMVLGEGWVGKGRGYKNIIGVTIGTGVGGGIVVASKILLGSVGIAGELGHFSINSEGKKCTCGNVGCYEQYASTTALIRNVKEKYELLGVSSFNKEDINGKFIFEKCTCGNVGCYEQYASTTALIRNVKEKYELLGVSSFNKEDINGKFIFEQIEKGNKIIKEIVSNWIIDIGKGLVSLVHIFNPEIIIIGGGVSKQEDLFIKPLRKYVLENVMKKFGENLKIESAELGNNAGVVGAVYYNIKSNNLN